MRAEVERRLGYALPDFELGPADHRSHRRSAAERTASSLSGAVKVGLTSGEQLVAVAARVGIGQDVRVTRQQNFVTSISTADVDRVDSARRAQPAVDQRASRRAIACTGSPATSP
jgi:hypothetical protein